ncbi:MAG TPA: matrixin family metalloprotease [Vicinamibacteria bacterium]|nr:matrixin family metalloprotease [Vicinamibacteria bacterium]
MRRAIGLFLLIPLAGCGGGGGGGTTPSASASLVDGASGAAVGGAAVSARPGDSVTVERAGYLRRDTIVARDNVISLWPNTVDEAYVRTLVYSETALRNRLVRWPGTTITVPRDLPAEISQLVQPWVTLVPSDTPAVTIVVDPTDPGFAPYPPDVIGVTLSQIADADAHFIASRIVFKAASDVRRPGALAHEFGHALGLNHSARQQDLMFPSTARTTTTFSPDERVLLTMMYTHRRPGQVAPDNDQALGQGATGIIRIIAQ